MSPVGICAEKAGLFHEGWGVPMGIHPRREERHLKSVCAYDTK